MVPSLRDRQDSSAAARSRWSYGAEWGLFWFLVGIVVGAAVVDAVLFGLLPGMFVGLTFRRSLINAFKWALTYWDWW